MGADVRPSGPEMGYNRGVLHEGDRMLIRCVGGPAVSRLVRYPPPLEVEVAAGLYVLVDDGPPHQWTYQYVGRR